MVAGGLPRPLAEGFASFDSAIAQDKFSAISSTVEDLTGRKPTSVADFLFAHRDALLPAAS
jgi:NAD(P)H dehydrogenase (quinone)